MLRKLLSYSVPVPAPAAGLVVEGSWPLPSSSSSYHHHHHHHLRLPTPTRTAVPPPNLPSLLPPSAEEQSPSLVLPAQTTSAFHPLSNLTGGTFRPTLNSPSLTSRAKPPGSVYSFTASARRAWRVYPASFPALWRFLGWRCRQRRRRWRLSGDFFVLPESFWVSRVRVMRELPVCCGLERSKERCWR